jgi:hypothetical protein
MRELDGHRLPHRIVGRASLEKRVRALLIALHRYGQHRAQSPQDVAWCSHLVVLLETALDVTRRERL